MSMLYVLIPLALLLLAAAAWALIWAIRSGQFDDMESHGWSVVLDDDQRPPPEPESKDVRGHAPGHSDGASSPSAKPPRLHRPRFAADLPDDLAEDAGKPRGPNP